LESPGDVRTCCKPSSLLPLLHCFYLIHSINFRNNCTKFKFHSDFFFPFFWWPSRLNEFQTSTELFCTELQNLYLFHFHFSS
jgi:hypothetical protein